MLGFHFYNLKILGKNHEEMIDSCKEAIFNLEKLREMLSKEPKSNIAYLRIYSAKTCFVIINAIPEEPFLQLFFYNSIQKKLYDAIPMKYFAETFKIENIIKDILDDITYNPENFIPHRLQNTINNYQDILPKLTTKEFENKTLDDFKIAIQDHYEDDFER